MAVIQYHGTSPESRNVPNSPASEASAGADDSHAPEAFDAEKLLLKGKDQAQQWVKDLEDLIQEKPRVALVAALGVGFVLRRLPLGKLIGAQLKLTASLIPPAIFAFGAAKLYETLKQPPQKH